MTGPSKTDTTAWRLAVTLATALLATSSCAEGQSSLDRGAEILQPFKLQLQQALQTGMAEGPEAAIEVCRLKAPLIAATLGSESIRLGRSSHKLRNPANAPEPWMSIIINDYLDDPDGRIPVAVGLNNDRIGYAEPIIVKPVCLFCHGQNIAPAVQEQLSELYPQDQATGFQLNALRGIFWAEFAVD